MYNLTIHFGPNAVAWSFLFKDKEKAEQARQGADVAMCQNEGFFIEDEFGQRASVSGIHGVLLEDMEAGQEARIVRGIDQAKGQLRANKRAQTDPEVQAFMREQQRSPAIIDPMGRPNGGFHRQ